jgi:alkaline phosphatase
LAQGPLYEATTVQSTASLLPDLVRIAIKNLQTNRRGYLLVVDDPSIAAAAAANDGETMLSRLLAFDQAVSTARHYAGANALIVITGRENIGGFQLNGFPFLRDKGVAILALNNQGYPSLCWATGPGYSNEGTSETPRGKKQGAANTSPMGILTQPSAYSSQKAVGSGGDVLSLGIGQGSEKIHGFLNLTDLHDIVREAL